MPQFVVWVTFGVLILIFEFGFDSIHHPWLVGVALVLVLIGLGQWAKAAEKDRDGNAS